jgi:mannosyl-oligosaccharide alpha-1,2-mannosidase
MLISSGWAWYNASNQAYDPSNNANPTYRQQAEQDGYFTTNAQYASFPETIESIFYAWRITGDPIWQEYNWGIFQALERESSATVPYASISDVNQQGSFVDYLPRYVTLPDKSDGQCHS